MVRASVMTLVGAAALARRRASRPRDAGSTAGFFFFARGMVLLCSLDALNRKQYGRAKQCKNRTEVTAGGGRRATGDGGNWELGTGNRGSLSGWSRSLPSSLT